MSALPRIVLLHGFTAIPAVWNRVAENLRRDHEVLVPALLGHQGGVDWTDGRDDGIEAIAADLEDRLDREGIGRAHLAGNSLGGWLAFELAARGRAESVTAFCPAGFWNGTDDPEMGRLRKIFNRAHRDGSRSRRLLPFLFRFRRMRRFAFASIAFRGDRLTREEALASVDGLLGCSAFPDLFDGLGPGARSYEDLDCPVTVLMAEGDRMFPPEPYTAQVAKRVPGAEVRVLDGLGHVPMIDDPDRVAEEIRRSVALSGNR